MIKNLTGLLGFFLLCSQGSLSYAQGDAAESTGSPLRLEAFHKLPLQEYKQLRLKKHLQELAEQNKRGLKSRDEEWTERPAKYDAVVTFLEQLHAQYPTTTELFDLGLNDDNVMIKGIRIGFGNLHNLVVGTHHGNEYGSTEVAKAFAADMAKNPLVDQSLFVIPVLNISGYNRNSRNEMVKGQSYDSNRSYPGPCINNSGNEVRSTNLLAQFLEKENIITSMTLHTYFPAITYPWGVTSSQTTTDDQSFFQQLAKFASTGNSYYLGTSTDVIYPADGTFEDYAYWKHGIWSLLYEIGTSHSPSTTAVEKSIRETVPGMRLVFQNSRLERSKNHDFKGQCSGRVRSFDPHME